MTRSSTAPLALPAALVMLVMLVAPLAVLFRYSLNLYDPSDLMVEALTPGNYVAAVADPYYRDVLVTTLRVALASTLVALLAGLPAAYTLARLQSRRWKTALTLLTVFPLLVGNVVRSAGWMVLLGNTGAINGLLRAAGLTQEPLRLMYTEGAVVVGIATVVLPYMILTLASVMEGVPRTLEEAARNLGAPPLRAFVRVVLPLCTPGLIAGTALVFILAMNAYATPVLLGGAQFKMMAPAVYDQFVRSTNWPFGAALAFILLAVTLLLTFAGTTLLGRPTRARAISRGP